MRFLLIAILLFISSTCLATPPSRIQFRDNSGRITGSATTNGRNTYYNNRYGQRVGSAYTNGNRTSFRDSVGRQTGSAYGKFNPALHSPKGK